MTETRWKSITQSGQRGIEVTRKAARLASSLRFVPGPQTASLVISQDGPVGNWLANLNSRTLVHLLDVLTSQGLQVCFDPFQRNAIAFLRLANWIRGLKVSPLPVQSHGWPVSIYDESGRRKARAEKHWAVVYDYRPWLPLDANDFMMPYGMSPALVLSGASRNLAPHRSRRRRVRVLFAGRMGSAQYDKKSYIQDIFGKATRFELVQSLRDIANIRFVEEPAESLQLFRDADASGTVVMDSARCPVPNEKWLETVSEADFLICTPGQIMPMCHNIVEAMAVGTVPLTNYPEWFFPPLIDGVNCISFDSPDDLNRKLMEAESLSAAEVEGMRRSCIDYYERYLEPSSVMSRIASFPGRELRLHVLDEVFHRMSLYGPVCNPHQVRGVTGAHD